MRRSIHLAAALLAVLPALGACDDHVPFRSLIVSVHVTKATGEPTTAVVPSNGPIVTADPDLACKLSRDARPRASTVECVRASTEETVSASFACPESDGKSASTVGWLIVNSPKLKLSHSFSADCSYGK